MKARKISALHERALVWEKRFTRLEQMEPGSADVLRDLIATLPVSGDVIFMPYERGIQSGLGSKRASQLIEDTWRRVAADPLLESVSRDGGHLFVGDLCALFVDQAVHELAQRQNENLEEIKSLLS